MKKIIRTLVIDRGGSAADCGHPFRICPIVDLCRADLVGAFGCLVAALNFRDAENDDDSHED